MTTIEMEKSTEPDTQTEKVIAIDGPFDVKLDKRLNRKFDIHILPWLFGIW
jgi:precorrin-6x reductase